MFQHSLALHSCVCACVYRWVPGQRKMHVVYLKLTYLLTNSQLLLFFSLWPPAPLSRPVININIHHTNYFSSIKWLLIVFPFCVTTFKLCLCSLLARNLLLTQLFYIFHYCSIYCMFPGVLTDETNPTTSTFFSRSAISAISVTFPQQANSLSSPCSSVLARRATVLSPSFTVFFFFQF